MTGDGQTFKEKLLSKFKTQYKSLRKAFYELDRYHRGFVTFEQFHEIVQSWGFASEKAVIKEGFDWLDYDKDQKISFLDLKHTIGLELMPQEQFFFRQDIPRQKNLTCKYLECWENTQFDSKSPYCPLHQKIIRNLVIDLFERLNRKISDSLWLDFRAELRRSSYIVSIGNLQTMLNKYAPDTVLNYKDKEFIYEAFKAPHDERGRPIVDAESVSELSSATLDKKLVLMTKLEKLRNNTRDNKVKALISLDEDDAENAKRKKMLGQKPVNEQMLVETAMTNLLSWSKVWREIRTLDIDRNGFIEKHELEQLLRDQFPVELEKYSFFDYFEKYPCSYDPNLVNYLPIKNALNSKITLILLEQK